MHMFAQLARDYGVPIEHLNNPQVWQALQASQPAPDPRAIVKEELLQMQLQQTIADFEGRAEKDFPHYNEVRQTMAGLLQAGMAADLESAYSKAIRMHDDIWDAEQHRKAQASEQQKRDALARAKTSAKSVKSSAPTGSGNTSRPSTDLRSQIAEAFASHEQNARV
jgi:hypothetical protein